MYDTICVKVDYCTCYSFDQPCCIMFMVELFCADCIEQRQTIVSFSRRNPHLTRPGHVSRVLNMLKQEGDVLRSNNSPPKHKSVTR